MSDTCCCRDNQPPSDDGITGREHWVDSGDVRIFIWEKYRNAPAGKPVVVLAHGSATAGRESFDLQVPGKPSISLMDALAGMGFDVFAPDIRGFGRSTQPEGHMTTAEAARDLDVAVGYILELRALNQVNLLGWSWGTQYGGLWVAEHPDRVERFVSYAQMHVDSPDIAMRRTKVDLYRAKPYVQIPEEGWKHRFYSMTPEGANDPQVVDCFAAAAARIEKQTPTGPQLDMVTIMPMIHARLITVPTMVIHGQYDDVADTSGLFPFFSQLPNPEKKYVVIPQAGHMMHLQKGHRMFQSEVGWFFKGNRM